MKGPHPEDADGFRAAWLEAQQRWTETIGTSRSLDEERRCVGPGHPKPGLWPCATA